MGSTSQRQMRSTKPSTTCQTIFWWSGLPHSMTGGRSTLVWLQLISARLRESCSVVSILCTCVYIIMCINYGCCAYLILHYISHKSVPSLIDHTWTRFSTLSTALDSNPFDIGLPGHHGPSNPVSVPGLVIFVLIGLLAVVAIAVVVYKCKRQESPREYLASV